jgi:hypothetical protein
LSAKNAALRSKATHAEYTAEDRWLNTIMSAVEQVDTNLFVAHLPDIPSGLQAVLWYVFLVLR